MPYVNIQITRDGVTAEQKRRLIAGATDLLVLVLGKNPATTVVVIDEIEPDNWGIGGESVTARRRRDPASAAARVPALPFPPMKKHGFIVYSGATETGRVFHALTHARQAHERGDEVALYFASEGTVWPGLLAAPKHPLHALFSLLQKAGVLRGACENCAAAFGHTESAGAVCTLVKGPAASYGQIDILGLHDEGFHVWMF
jgi:4-oxalocrotonate tautomerase